MINGKELAKQLDKFLESPVCQGARVQIKLPRGEFRSPDGFFDIKSIHLLQNNVIAARECHRIVIEIAPQTWRMGSLMKKL